MPGEAASELRPGGWPSSTKKLTAQLSLAALRVESNLGKAETGGEDGSGLRGLPNAKLSSHSPKGLRAGETVVHVCKAMSAVRFVTAKRRSSYLSLNTW